MSGAPARPDPARVRRAAVVGAGTIGASWAALLLARGIEVDAHDEAEGAEARLRAAVDATWPALEELGLVTGAARPALRFHAALADACADAEFVQESIVENETAKIELLAAIDAAAPAATVIASSTSTYLPSRLQSACARPERVLVGHPFTPPALVPLVEVVGGEATGGDAIEWAMALYRRLGQHPIRLRREIQRHVTNRLQSVLWNEAVRLVEEGVVSVADVDAAVCMGPGMRLAFMGPILSHHFAGGDGGLARALEMFGGRPDVTEDRATRVDPSPALAEVLVRGVEEEVAGRDMDDLRRWRNRMLVAVRKAVTEGGSGGDLD